MKVSVRAAACSSLVLVLAACGGGETPATEVGAGAVEAADAGAAAASSAATPSQTAASSQLAMSPSWMPADWDQNAYQGADVGMQPELVRKLRQEMINTVPFTLWAIANDTLLDEAYEPVWVWYTALRSCERGIQMSEDLAGEFGDRARGKAALTTARNELKAWAATQPREMTLYFTAKLGQWNEATGAFPLQVLSKATTLKPKDARDGDDPYHDGATVELYGGESINHFQASLREVECVSKDQTTVHRFPRMQQWWVIFGDADRGMGGLVDYKSRALLPKVTMTRENAAALAQRNPERNVEVAVTFEPAGSTFVKGGDQPAIRANYKQVVITDALDGSVLAQQAY